MRRVNLGNYVLRRYWSEALTREAIRLLSEQPETRESTRAWTASFEKILGSETFSDFTFEARAAEQFAALSNAPFYIHVHYNLHLHAARSVAKAKASPCFPVDRPFNPLDWVILDPAPTTRQLETHAKSPAEVKVANCKHEQLGIVPSYSERTSLQSHKRREQARRQYTSLHLKFELAHLDISFFAATVAPRCQGCNAAIICKCIQHDILKHIGYDHDVLYADVYQVRPRDGTTSIGFKQGLCDLCRTTTQPLAQTDADSENFPTSKTKRRRRRSTSEEMNETDKLKFYNVYSAMRAIRLMRQEDAMLYHRLFSGDEKKSKQSINIALAKSYIAIASGVSPKDIPKDFLTNSTSDDRECWRSYFRRGRDFFRSHYNLPGIGAGWLSESRLLTIVRNIFPAEVVHHNSRPTFLEGLQLDVYIPRINVAFEYMGRQHYEPVDFFGGEVAFESVKKRDAKKRQLCAEHGVRLIHVHYDDELSEGNIRRLMRS